jgi:cytochrome c peroxidase
MGACVDSTEERPLLSPSADFRDDDRDDEDRQRAILADSARLLAANAGITRVPRAPFVRPELARLGQMLLFDKVLSGNRNISCMTCHPPRFATSDARSLSIGEGGSGIGPNRVHPRRVFIPRNAPAFFNLAFLDNLFWDGRVARDAAGTFHTPAGAQLTSRMTRVFEFGAISALGLFPVANRAEMRGRPTDNNELARISDDNLPAIWSALMRRLMRIDEYRRLFREAYPRTDLDDMTFAHASNAMAAFIIDEFTLNRAPWDDFLAGSDRALSREQLNGAMKFLKAPCATCHDGPIFSDDSLQNVAVAQFGPGQGNGPSGRDDFGRMNVTGNPADIYKFRTSPLRNIELTAPYGHAGQFAELARFNDHYSQSADKLRAYSDADIPDPLLRGTLVDNKEAVIATRAERILPVAFDSVFVREVTSFMRALTDPRARFLGNTIPDRVPSGLRVDR